MYALKMLFQQAQKFKMWNKKCQQWFNQKVQQIDIDLWEHCKLWSFCQQMDMSLIL